MAVLSQGGDVGLQFSAGSVEGLRLCSQASLSFSSTLYVAPFVQSWHWNKHTVIRYCYERRKNFMSLSALSKYFYIHHIMWLSELSCDTFCVKIQEAEAQTNGGGAFPRRFLLPSLAVFSPLSSTCKLISLFSGLEFWSPLWHLSVKGSKLILCCCGKVWRVLTKLTMWPSNSTPVYVLESPKHNYTKTCARMFIAALFIIAKEWK